MGIPAKTLLKVKSDKFEKFCDVCDQNKISVLDFVSDGVGGTVYVSLHSPKGHILKIAEQIEPYIIGNVAGCW